MVGIKRFLWVTVCAVSGFSAAAEPAFVHVIWNKTRFPMGPISGSQLSETETITQPSFRATLKNRLLEFSSRNAAIDHGALLIEGIRLSVKIEQIETTAITEIEIPEIRGLTITKRKERKEIGLPTLKDQILSLNEIEKLQITLPNRLDLISDTHGGTTTWRVADAAGYEAAMRSSLEAAITPELVRSATKPNLSGIPDFAKGPIERAFEGFTEANAPKIRAALIEWGLSQATQEKILRAVSKALPLNTLPEGELVWSLQKEVDGRLNLALGNGTEIPTVSGMKMPERAFEAIVIANEAGTQLLARCSAKLAEETAVIDPSILQVRKGQETKVKFEKNNGEAALTLTAELARGEIIRSVEAAFVPTPSGGIALRALFATQPDQPRQLWSQMVGQAKQGLESVALKALISEELAKSQNGEQRLFVKFTQGSVPGQTTKQALLVVEYR